MGGALYEVLRDFYGTDDVSFVLNSAEAMPSGSNTRSFDVVHRKRSGRTA